jgi:hypothetical protein
VLIFGPVAAQMLGKNTLCGKTHRRLSPHDAAQVTVHPPGYLLRLTPD